MDESKYILRPMGLLVFRDSVTHMDYPLMWVMSKQEGEALAQNLNAAYQRVLRKEKNNGSNCVSYLFHGCDD